MTDTRPHDAPLRLEAFGTPRLLRAGRALRLGSRKAMAVVLVLALDGAQARETLAALLWPDVDAAAARRNLRRELFRLRTFELRIAERDDGAVELAVAPALALDVDEGQALQGLDGLAGEHFEAWLQRARMRLQSRRAADWHAHAQAARARGDAATALALVQRQLQADPCDEAAALQAVQLLQQLGRPADARALVRQLAAALRQQLDLPLSAALRAAVAEPAEAPAPPTVLPLAPAPAPSGPLIPARTPYVDRPLIHQRVQGAWDQGLRVYLAGAAGVGKSRLAQELAAQRGGWIRLRCEPDDALVPYASAVRALRALRDAAPDVRLPDWVRRELAQLLPEDGPAPVSPDADAARARLVAAHAAAFAALVADNFQVLVFDDWHWADAASLELWAAADPPAGVGVLMAYRAAQLPPAALRRQRGDVDAGRAVQLTLDGLDDAQTLALVQALSGSTGGVLFSQRLHRATAGNPFFLLETLRHLQQQGVLQAHPAGGWRTPFDAATTDYAELPVPPTVRDAVRARVRALGEAPQRLLEAASLLAGRFDARSLQDVTTLDEDRLLAALAHAGAAQLVVEDEAGWRFVHDLVPQCLAAAIGPARRRALHRRLAASLARTGAAPALVASHQEAAGEIDAAGRGYTAAAESALRVHALAQALGHWDDALRCGAQGAAAAAIHLARAAVHRRRGDPQAAQAALDAAARAVQDAGADDAAQRGRAEVQLARAEAWVEARPDDALALLDALEPALPGWPPALQARARQLRWRVLTYAERLPEATEMLRQAIASLHRVPGEEARRAGLLDTLARARLRAGDLPGCAAASDEAVALLEAADLPAPLADALTLQAVAALFAGEPERARDRLLRARELARRCGHVPAQRAALLNLVKLAADAGDTAQASALLDEGEALAPGFEHARAEQAFREARFYVQYLRGDLPAARASAARLIEAVERVAGHSERIGARHVVVDLHLLAGELDAARRLLADAQALSDAQAAGAGGGHFQVQQAAKMAWLRLAEGDPQAALALLARSAPPQRLEDAIAFAWIGSAAARTLGDGPEARRWLARAVPGDAAPTDQQALWLLQALALAAVDGQSDAALRQRAAALASGGRVPAQLAERLRRALAG
ncbi:MAG: AAA family ATPase [Rubrivivax sp.]|nr:AAA family ATPase [Rubrivivax sp.]